MEPGASHLGVEAQLVDLRGHVVPWLAVDPGPPGSEEHLSRYGAAPELDQGANPEPGLGMRAGRWVEISRYT